MQCLSQGARGCLIFVSREQLLPDICFVRQVGDQYLSEQVNCCLIFVSRGVCFPIFVSEADGSASKYLSQEAGCLRYLSQGPLYESVF